MSYPLNPHKVRNGIRQLGAVDLSKIIKSINSIEDFYWEKVNDKSLNLNKKSDILKEAEHITFKFTSRKNGNYNISYAPLWEKYKEAILVMLTNIASVYNYPEGHFPRIMLAKLPPKTFILPHTDGNSSSYAPHKIHVPLLSNDKAFFFVNGQRHSLKEGFAYEVDNIAMHSAINSGDTDRIHLIFEYMYGKEKTP